MCYCTPTIRTPFCNNCHSYITEMQSELAACRKDADRYRWIRENECWVVMDRMGESERSHEFLDIAIDNHMSHKESGE